MHLVEPMHARGGLFRNAPPFLYDFVPAIGIFTMNLEQQILDYLFFPVR